MPKSETIPIPARRCLRCRVLFKPRRKDTKYCSDRCRGESHADLRRHLKYSHDEHVVADRAIPVMPDRKTREELLSPFYTKIEGEACVYCGQQKECTDHVLPLRVMELMYVHSLVHKTPLTPSEIVPSCTMCNSIAGDKAFRGIEDKTRYIHTKRREKGFGVYIPTPEIAYTKLDQKSVSLIGEWEVCAVCTKRFVTERNGQKFCSSSCLAAYKPKGK